MTPQEFAEKMREICQGTDTEGEHISADDLLCQALREAGYGEGVDVYDKINKWYA